MPTLRLDHFITFTDAAVLEDHTAKYRAAGFNVLERTARHAGGLRTGFVAFWPEYMEFAWVEDQELFAQADGNYHQWRAALRPWGIGLATDDVRGLHDEWTARGCDVPAVESTIPRDAPADTPPVYSFQEVPADLLPGAHCFALTYHHPSIAAASRKIRPGSNTTYAIAGVTFVCAAPDVDAARWRDLLAPDAAVRHVQDGREVAIGPHLVQWCTPDGYRARYGRTWPGSPHEWGKLAVLHLLATDLELARRSLQGAGRHVAQIRISQPDRDALLVSPDEHDGFVFAIEERPLDDWIRERNMLTGETLVPDAGEAQT